MNKKIRKERIIRNIFRCPLCGAEVYSFAGERNCYKCETKMKIIGCEGDYINEKK